MKTSIPDAFKNTVTEEEFKFCSRCEKPLFKQNEDDEEVVYMIEKCVIPGDIIYELALCLTCVEKAQNAMSEESKENMQQFMQNKVVETLENDGPINGLIDMIDPNEFKLSEIEGNYKRFNLMGYFRGGEFAEKFPVVCISEDIMAQLQEQLSKKTKEDLDDFMDFMNDIPPEFSELFDKRKPVFI